MLNGDIYGGGVGGFSVTLPAGAFILALRVRAVVQARVSCRLLPSPAEWEVRSPKLLPDIIVPEGPPDTEAAAFGDDGAHIEARLASPRFCGGLVGLPVQSTGHRWITELHVSQV